MKRKQKYRLLWIVMVCFFILSIAFQVKAVSEKEYQSMVDLETVINNKLAQMSIEQKVGQMLMIGFDGYYQTDFRLYQKLLHPGGVVLFRRNVKDTVQLKNLIAGVQNTAYETDGIGMFVSIDLEGGRVVQLPAKVIPQKLPAAAMWGNLYRINKDQAINGLVSQTHDISELFKKIGLNMNLAPVIDLKTGTDNSVIGDRAFDNEAENVADLGSICIESFQNNGVIPVVKHFPGHGITTLDTHRQLPSSLVTEVDFEKHLYPFISAVQNGAEVVMMSHLRLPEKDPFPASLSRYWVTQQLRENLGFQGVVMTDAMEMGAITKNYPWDQALIDAVNAGNDIILISSGNKYIRQSGSILLKAVETGLIDEDQVNDSVRRILKLKMKYGLFEIN